MYTSLDRKMASIYANRIDNGTITIEDVPEKIRPLVEEILNKD